MTTVIENQATPFLLRTDETFLEFANRISKSNVCNVGYKDGSLIELDPNLEYSFVLLGLKRLLTPEEFAFVYTAMMDAVHKLEVQGVLSEGLVETVATPFDIPARPAIPNQFADTQEDGADIKTYLTGSLTFTMVNHVPPTQVEIDDAD